MTFTKSGEQVIARCTCRAGLFGKACKHRINILHGDKGAVVSDNADEVDEVAAWLEGSDIAAALEIIVRLEKEKKRIARELSKAKKAVAVIMATDSV